MSKVLLFSHNGFSDENANGITMKNLLSAWDSGEKAEFYCDVELPDFSAADNYFRVTDMQMLAALMGKKSEHIFNKVGENADFLCAHNKNGDASVHVSRIPKWLKKHKYNFGLKWFREILWEISPWGHKMLERWIDSVAPTVVVYMVGESIFMDRLVLRTISRTSAKLVLYNGEAYRIINLRERHGIERAYYRRVANLYRRLNENASLVIFNCLSLKESYSEVYQPKSNQIVAYNSASCTCAAYHSHSPLTISYFGNLGVGRVDSLISVAEVLYDIDNDLILDIYGNATDEDKSKFEQHINIRYHGFVPPEVLPDIAEKSDILIHVESFEEERIAKLRYAFSTKLAQYLCSGRPVVCYAPKESASSEYLCHENGALVATNCSELKSGLKELISNPDVREEYANRAKELGAKNHNREITALFVKQEIDTL